MKIPTVRSKGRFAALSTLLLFLGSSPVAAQGIAKSFDELRLLVRPGDSITIVDAKGLETTGKISRLAPSSITVLVGTATTAGRDFREEQVTRILQRRGDPLGNGALWGFLGGAGFVVTMAAIFSAYDDGDVEAGGVAVAAALYGGIGAGIGVAVDAMIEKRQIIFERSSTHFPIAIAPVFTGARRGLVVTFRF